MDTTRIAIIGFGRWGRFCHAALIRATPDLELAGIASSSTEKREQIEAELGVRAYKALEDVLADSTVDAIVIATPNDTHFDYALRALEAGKHVITDKPMCLSLQECDAMIARSKRSGKLLTTFQNRRLDGDFLTLQQLLRDGELGDLRWMEMAWSGFGPWGGWRGNREQGGGKFLDLGAHLVDQTLVLMGVPVVGVYLREHHDYPQSEVESEALLVLEFENGATAVCDTSSMAAIDKPRFYARGTKATFQKFGLDPQEAALMKGDIRVAQEDPVNYGHLKGPEVNRIIPTLAGNWGGYYANFAEAVRGQAPLLAPPEETRRVMAVFEAAQTSAKQGQVVRTEI